MTIDKVSAAQPATSSPWEWEMFFSIGHMGVLEDLGPQATYGPIRIVICSAALSYDISLMLGMVFWQPSQHVCLKCKFSLLHSLLGFLSDSCPPERQSLWTQLKKTQYKGVVLNKVKQI